ncbi:MAG TPA: hypothetical protein VFQ71_03990 [Gaiellales bacterium]|jgi:hypothetical protein|nr:hypothetical protein [Gaiellales bacterium]
MAEEQTLPAIEEESRRLLDAAGAAGLEIRLTGGLAIRAHADGEIPEQLRREYHDIDLVTRRSQSRAVERFLADAGYTPNHEFNALNGRDRLLFYDLPRDRQLDVFVGHFKMCHEIPIADRLELDPVTVPLAELLLTKLQIYELNEKDRRDVLTILATHEVGDGDGETVNAQYIGRLCADDWGLWRTLKLNVERCHSALEDYGFDTATHDRIRDRLDTLWAAVDAAPKSRRWKMRDRVGDRKRWYELPDEVV